MSQMETSLRRALEAGDVSDPAFRESIYAASERALERMLESRGADEAVRFEQRSRLAETINRVEGEHAQADAAHDDAAYDEAGAYEADEAPDERGAPADGRVPQAPAPGAAGVAEPDVWTPGGTGATKGGARVRSRLAVPLAAVVFAVLLAILAYVVAGAVRGGSDAATGGTVTGDASSGALASASDLGWIDVFDGNDLEALSTPNGGRIETVAKPDEREAVRVSAPTGGEGEVLLTMGAGVMRQISGRQVRIELTAGSPNAALREFGIRCLAADQSFCDRQRFSTAMSEEAFVFDVAVPAGVTSAGSIAIGPGLNGTPNDVDIYALRIRALG
ncbi:MAG: hypothetical protein ABW179_07360 [Methylobacterium sp.]